MDKKNYKKESLTKIIAIAILALISLFILSHAFTDNSPTYSSHGMMDRMYGNNTGYLDAYGINGGINSLVIQLVGLFISLSILFGVAFFVKKYSDQEKVQLTHTVDAANKIRECPGCSSKISDEFKFCPVCSAKLIVECDKCKRIIQESWQYCPYCGSPKDLVSGQ